METGAAAGWYSGLNKVYAYIDGHLAEDLSLAALSAISGYSEYHFHRLFHAMAGQTPHEYVLERRIMAAAGRLMYDRCSITRIALDCGFASSSSFVRSYIKSMGCSPSEYRRNKERKRPLDLEAGRFRSYQPDPSLDALFFTQTFEDLNVAGIAIKGLSQEFESAPILAAFQRLFGWLAKQNLAGPGLVLMGMTLDTPEVAPFEKCRYFACAAVGKDVKPEGEIAVRIFPTGGQYVCFTMKRSRPDFPKAFFFLNDYLYGYRMPMDGLYPDSRPFVECYRQVGGEIEITFCVPVKRKDSKK